MIRSPAALLVITLFAPLMVQARPVSMPGPEEMEANASVVCNGFVKSVEATGKKIEFHDTEHSPEITYMTEMKARIKLLHAFKGQPPVEFILVFNVIDDSKYPRGIGDGPQRIFLQKGKRYRFFLKPGDTPGKFLGVLNGELDDAFAAEPLWPREADDHGYIRRDAAIKIARNYVLSIVHNATFDGPISAWRDPLGWTIFLSQDSTPQSACSALNIRGDGTVDVKNAKVLDTPQ